MKRKHFCSRFMFLIALWLMFGVATPAFAGGWLDPRFGKEGVVETDFFGGFDQARDLVVQPDGKLIAVGEADTLSGSGWKFDFAIARYLPNGALDTSFSEDGRAILRITTGTDIAYAAAVQPDGRIVVGGVANAAANGGHALVRYNIDGSLDDSFGVGGVAHAAGGLILSDLVLQPDGKIVVVGNTALPAQRFALARYNSNGSPDDTFGDNGLIITDVAPGYSSVACRAQALPNGNILAFGNTYGPQYHIALARYRLDGSLDDAFGNGGIATPDTGPGASLCGDMSVDAVGRILLGLKYERPTTRYGVTRVSPEGVTDTTFGEQGHAYAPATVVALTGVALQRDGKIVTGGREQIGSKQDFAAVRFNENGGLDASFGDNGRVNTGFGIQAWAIALTANDQIILGGATSETNQSDFGVVRLLRWTGSLPRLWLPLLTRETEPLGRNAS